MMFEVRNSNLSNNWIKKNVIRDHYDSASSEYDEECNTPPIRFLLSILDKEILHHVRGHKGYVLDLGCGTGRNLLSASEEAACVIGVDISKNILRIAKEKISKKRRAVQLTLADAENLPLRDNVCSSLFSNYGTLNHLPLPRLAIIEMVRVAAPGGLIIVWAVNKFDIVSIASLLLSRKWSAVRQQFRGEDIRKKGEKFFWYGTLLDLPTLRQYFISMKAKIETIKATPLFLHLLFSIKPESYKKLFRFLHRIDSILGTFPILRYLGMGILIKARKTMY